jgi:hypothetical protein
MTFTLLIKKLHTRYLLATCTFTPLYGRLCNVLGRKGASHVAILFASAGVLMSGLSSSMEMLIASRFVCRSTFCNYKLVSGWIARRYRWRGSLYCRFVSLPLSYTCRKALSLAIQRIVVSDMHSLRVMTSIPAYINGEMLILTCIIETGFDPRTFKCIWWC